MSNSVQEPSPPGRGQREGELLRLFVAIELPEDWRQALALGQAELRSALEAEGLRLRWTRPEGIHLTLKFLGEVEAGRRGAIEAALAGCLTRPPRLRLRLGQPGLFTSGRRTRFTSGRPARVLWVGVEGDIEGLARLADEIDRACAGLGLAAEQRSFTGHLTLARVPESVSLPADSLAPKLQTIHLPETAPFVVERVSLIRSHLGPGGSRYERLAAFPV